MTKGVVAKSPDWLNMEQEEKASEDAKTREESCCLVQSLFRALEIMPGRWQLL